MSSLRRSAYILSVLVPLALGAVDAANGAAVLLTDNRHIRADAFIQAEGPDGTDVDAAAASPPSPFAPWSELVVASASISSNATIATAFQSSAITPTLFTATLSGEVETVAEPSALGAGEASSEFRVGFALATPHIFVLTAIWQEAGFPNFPSGFVWLTFGSHAFTGPTDPTDLISATGVLGPGIYDFRAIAIGLGPGRSTGDAFHSQFAAFEFALTQVPEPSTLILLAAAVAGTAWCVRRKVRSGEV
jgi:hypothetical protein